MLLGAAHGIVLVLYIITSKVRNKKARFFLSLFVLAFSIDNVRQVFLESGVYNSYPQLVLIPGTWVATVSISFFFYIYYLLNPAAKTKPWQLLLLALLVLERLFYTTVIFSPAQLRLAFYKSTSYYFLDLVETSVGVILALSLTWGAFRLLGKNLRNDNLKIQSIKGINYLRYLALALFFLSAVWLITEVSFMSAGKLEVFYPLWILMTITVYWIGYLGYRNSDELKGDLKLRAAIALDRKTLSYHLKKIRSALDHEKLYRKSELNLSYFAKHIGINQTYLSQLINDGMGTNFIDLVNRYRVEEVKRKLLDPANEHIKIIALAYESGFNSKSTFNKVFKDYTNLTPKGFRETSMTKRKS